MSANPSSRYSFEILERLPRLTLIQHVEKEGSVWATRNRQVFRREGDVWNPFGQFPLNPPRDLFAGTRLGARASRADKCSVYVNSESVVFGIRDGSVYSFSDTGVPTEVFSVRGKGPLARGMCEDIEGGVYFGEYFQNTARGPVRILRLGPEPDRAEVAYEFHAGSVRHVHGLHRDPFDPEAIWVSVGDYENECFLFRTRDRFKTLERFGDGSQTWRAVGLLFTERAVCWITDSHLERNRACRMDRESGDLEIGQEVDCSCWNAVTTEEGVHLAFTTVEKGPAIMRDEASILASDDGFEWSEIASFKKDFWRPMSVFKYGAFSLPTGKLRAENFYLSGEGLVGLDGRSLRVRIRRLHST